MVGRNQVNPSMSPRAQRDFGDDKNDVLLL